MVRVGSKVTVRDKTIAMQTEGSIDRKSIMIYRKTPTEEMGLNLIGSKDGGEASFLRKNEDEEIATDLKITFNEISHFWKTLMSWFRAKVVEFDDVTSELPIEDEEAKTKYDADLVSELTIQEVQAKTRSDRNVASELPTEEALVRTPSSVVRTFASDSQALGTAKNQ